MKELLLYFCIGLLCGGCARDPHTGEPTPGDTTLVVYAPAVVKKSVSKKVFAHLMPWFESKHTNQPTGAWGQHWTMANQNPDLTDASGRRQIASHYYPLIGPYASADPNVIEYQLLLMKFSGIDGVFIDWPGTTQLYDYPRNAENAGKIIAMLGKAGLAYSIVYEDQNINIAYNKGVFTDKIAAARKDMEYLQTNYFGASNYEKVDGRPLLLVFGPQTFAAENDWRAIFSTLPVKPCFFTLWGASSKAGATAAGTFAWINPDNTGSLQNFYGNNYQGLKIGSAYPGFNTYYAAGGWGGPNFVINASGTGNFLSTLDLALQSNVHYIQLPTWNDYGEGTMIEPTIEFGYSLLTALQQRLGVNYHQPELELVNRLYALRTGHAGDAPVQRQLDQAFYYLVSLNVSKASDLLKSIN